MIRSLVIGVAAVALAAQVVRDAALETTVQQQPDVAAKIWPTHPSARIGTGMVEIAAASAAGRPAPKPAIARVIGASSRAPLAPQPFMVRGVEAQLAGSTENAIASFNAAKLREPRAAAARYFLADLYLKAGRTRDGLLEIAKLGKLVPPSVAGMAPFLATFASDRRHQDEMRAVFRAEPALEGPVLSILAAQPASADLVLALANPAGPARREWHAPLVDNLVAANQFARAGAIWGRLNRTSVPQDRAFDEGFASTAPPPFNWTLAANAVGSAERSGNGALQVTFFGREDGPLANQLLLLRPGSYRIAMTVAGSIEPGSLQWAVSCLPAKREILRLPVRGGGVAGRFTVPAGCPAQTLLLEGRSGDFPKTVDATIGGFQIRREGAQ